MERAKLSRVHLPEVRIVARGQKLGTRLADRLADQVREAVETAYRTGLGRMDEIAAVAP